MFVLPQVRGERLRVPLAGGEALLIDESYNANPASMAATLKVLGDEAMLVTAVHNLIANAIQYSTKPSRVGIGVTRTDDIVEIAVTDQGVGIPDDELDRVFERFFRVDQARSRATGGTGLGLSIVKHIVQNHGGDVRVWSQAGHGSTFTIRLPRPVEQSTEPAPKKKKVRA